MSANSAEQRLNRLRWSSRRGMKELDVLLEAFVARESENLAAGAWPQFEELLSSEDDVLWDWFQGRGAPESSNLRHMVVAIRG